MKAFSNISILPKRDAVAAFVYAHLTKHKHFALTPIYLGHVGTGEEAKTIASNAPTSSDIPVHWTASSCSKRHNGAFIQLSFAEANQQLRQGNYLDALKAYLTLLDEYPLSVYEQNAWYAAKKLNYSGAQLIADLRAWQMSLHS
jgi:TolA-binding protein